MEKSSSPLKRQEQCNSNRSTATTNDKFYENQANIEDEISTTTNRRQEDQQQFRQLGTGPGPGPGRGTETVRAASTVTTTKTTHPPPPPPPTKQRNKLKRCAAKQSSIDQIDEFSIIATTRNTTAPAAPASAISTLDSVAAAAAAATAAAATEAAISAHSTAEKAMGGGFTTPTTRIVTKIATATTNTTTTTNATTKQTITTALTKNLKQMHEKLLEKDENLSKEKTDKLKLLKSKETKSTTAKTAAAATLNSATSTAAAATSTTSKFAEKLRRSFRRGEHKSLELRKSERRGASPPPLPASTSSALSLASSSQPQFSNYQQQQQQQNNFYASNNNNNNNNNNKHYCSHQQQQQQQQFGFDFCSGGSSSSSIGGGGASGTAAYNRLRYSQQSLHSLNSLPATLNANTNCTTGTSATGGGHINPALLLDSPDEATPPEFAYQHLSSVATTNSSTSLESNFGDTLGGDRNDLPPSAPPTTSHTFWTWPQQNQNQSQQQTKQQQQAQLQHQQTYQEFEDYSLDSQYSTINAPMGGGVTSRIGSKDVYDNDEQQQPPAPSSSSSSSAAAAAPSSPPPAPPPPPPPPTSPRLNSQSSSKSDTIQAHPIESPSCSITSDISTTKITRLQNCVFKSSNESRSSYQGHSNEGFTASSHNSSSGEWENVGACSGLSMSGGDFNAGSFPEEFEAFATDNENESSSAAGAATATTAKTTTSTSTTTTAAESSDSTGGSYYQYTLSSPNNPFLPEIIARTYHSHYDDEPDDYLDANITSVKYISGGTHSHSHSHSHSHPHSQSQSQLATRDHSRAGSQESTHSDSGITAVAVSSPSPSPSPSTSSTPGRQRRKLFRLHSPTRHLLHQQSSHSHSHSHQQQQQQQQHSTTPSTSTEGVSMSNANANSSNPVTSVIASGYTGAGNLVRYLNPFLPSTSLSPSMKRAQLKQTPNVTSPTAVPQDLNAKREEFLRATMKICLVVSPPSSKLQMKSKSLTHLDGLDSMVACPHGGTPPANAASALLNNRAKSNTSSTHLNRDSSDSAVSSHHHHHHQHQHEHHQSQELKYSPSTLLLNVSGDSSSNSAITTSASFTASSAMMVSANIGSTLTTSNVSGGSGTASYNKKKSSFMQRKRALLPRSEVSSSEYFSISFSTETGQPDEEFIPATRGVTLAAAISPALRRRNLSFSQISIADTNPTSSFLEAGYSPLASSLDENTDVENLAGRHLVIIERDGNRKPLQKAASFGSRTRPARLLSSVSTEETSESAALPAKQLKQRWSGLFGIKNPQQSQLCELLNSYAKNGVPQRVVPPSIFMNPEMDAALNYLDDMHKSWRDFVESDDMAENEAKIQTAIWELVTTEVYYIHALQTVTDLFLACLEAIQHQNLLTDVDQHRLFANVREICEANIQFWTQHLYPMVAHSIATREPMDINFFEEGFITFATIFSPYTKYCAEQSSCQFYCKELNRNNALFTSYLAWCESQKMCNRLRLADILVRPMQRLTKYSLLLSAIKKPMTITEDIEAIETMIHCVENFVASVNNHLTQRQETERLKGVMARIESYDVLPNTNNEYLEKIIKQYSTFFDLCGSIKNVKPFHVRHLFMEGDHKFKDHMGKLDVHCFLFTDILLVCKNVAKKGLGAVKVIRQPYFTDRLLVHQTNNVLNCVYLNEFNLAVTAFTLQCSEAKNWFEALRRARMIYIKLKQTSANFESSHQSSISSSSAMVTNTSAATVSAPAAAPAAATAVTHATATMTTSATNALIMTTTADNIATTTNTSTMMIDTLSVRKSPLNSSFGSHVSSANNSHSGSVEWNDSRNISVDLEKTNSFSSDDGSGAQAKAKSPNKLKITTTSSANTLSVQPTNNLVQSLPNLNIQTNQHNKLCHTYSNNTLLVPGVRHTRNLLSPNFHNVSYPPPSPTRTTLRRTSAIPNNPPLVKTRNITSQSSINWHQIPATPTPAPTPLSPHATGCMANTTTSTPAAGAIIEGNDEVESLMASPPSIVPRSPPQPPSAAVVTAASDSDQQQQQQKSGGSSSEYLHQQNRQHHSNETDV